MMGGDERLYSVIQNRINNLGEATDVAIANVIKTFNDAWTGTDEQYAAAYAVARFLHNEIGGPNGIQEIIQDLAAGDSLSDAITSNTTYTIATLGDDADGTGANNIRTYIRSLYDAGDLTNADVGAIGGADADGGAVLDAHDVVDESLATDIGDDQPLTTAGWTITWPADVKAYAPNPWYDPLIYHGDFEGLSPFSYSPGESRLPTDTGLESVDGTFVIHSALTGRNGEITVLGDDALLDALGFSEIRKSAENKYTIDVFEAHSGTTIARGVQTSINELRGIIHPNIDVEFDANSGIQAVWDNPTRDFVFRDGASYRTSTFVHIADRSMVLHVGANSMQDLAVGIGDMSSRSLGVDRVMVYSNALANRAIASIDRAIGKVSSERAKLGAMQNRLDHTINNLVVSAENMTNSEAKIRDVDMAKEMMNYTRLNILSQAGISMLAQANQMSQGVLQLLR